MNVSSGPGSMIPIMAEGKLRNAVKSALLLALSTTALVPIATLVNADVITSSNITQVDDGVSENTLTIDVTQAEFFLNSASAVNPVQDSTLGQNTLNVDISDTSDGGLGANYIFVSQLGNVTQTLTIDGTGNTAILMDFGGTTAISDVFSITGNNNNVNLESNAVYDAHDNLGVTLAGDNIVLDVSIDDFAELVATLTGDYDDVTVVQNYVSNDIQTLGAQNIAIVDISGAVGGNVIGNLVKITQTGVNNTLDFDLVGDNNDITVTQTNDAAGLNDLTIDIEDDDAVLVINAFGIGVNSFIVAGSGNDLTVNSDTGATGISSTDAQAYIEVNGDGNTVTSEDYTNVRVVIGDQGIADNNWIDTTGNAEVFVEGDYSTIDFVNGFDVADYYDRPYINIDSSTTQSPSDNSLVLKNLNTGFGVQASFDVNVVGGGNNTSLAGLTVYDLAVFNLAITGDDNIIEGSISSAGGTVDIQVLGTANELYFGEVVGPSGSTMNIDVIGDTNIFEVVSTQSYADLNLNVSGSFNLFDYDLGAPLTHNIGGSGFEGEIIASDADSYAVDYESIGAGYSKVMAGLSSMLIKYDCGTYTEDDNGVGSCS